MNAGDDELAAVVLDQLVLVLQDADAQGLCDAASASCIPEECEQPDADGDGHLRIECGGDDCDDDDPNRYPTNPEVCDSEHDEDCDPTTVGVLDADDDEFMSATCCNADVCGRDCDDGDPDVRPGATELCNETDDDCDGLVDAMAFCPAGSCSAGRCRGTSWERVYDATHLGPVFVDGAANVYVQLSTDAEVDLDRDGSNEPTGYYLMRLSADGRIDWLTRTGDNDGSVTILEGALVPGADAIALSDGNIVTLYSTTDGLNIRNFAPPRRSGFDFDSIGEIAAAGDRIAILHRYTNTSPIELFGEIVVVDSTGAELGARFFDTHTNGLFRLSMTDTEVVVSGAAFAPTTIEPGTSVVGQFLVRMDHAGNIVGTIDSLPESLVDVALHADGSLSIVGELVGTHNPSWGGSEWDSTVPGETCTPNNGLFVVHFDESGDYSWHRFHSGPDCDAVRFVAQDRRGVLVAGGVSGEMEVEPQGRLSASERNPFYMLLDAEDGGRHVLDARVFPATGRTELSAATVDDFGGFVLVGGFNATLTLPSGATYDAGGANSGFIVKISDLP